MLQTWTDQRDALLRDIGVLSSEYNETKKLNVEGGLALKDLQDQIAVAKGRIAEIEALETRMRGSLATDIAELEVRKSRLQSECVLMDEKLSGGAEKFEVTTAAIKALETAHDVMKDQSAIVDRVVGEIIQTSQVHTSDMKVIMTEIKTMATDVIEKGNENLKQTNIVLEKLPKYVFELQRPIPVRRHYAEGHPRVAMIEPEPKKE